MMMKFPRQRLWQPKRKLILTGLLMTVFSLGFALYPLPLQSQGSSSLIVSPLPVEWSSHALKVIDADLLRVGISDNSFAEMEYPSAVVSATGRYKVIDAATGKTLFEHAAAATNVSPSVTIKVSGSGFQVYQATKLLGQNLAGPIRIEPIGSDCRLTLPAIRRKGQVPQYRGVIEIVRGYSAPTKLSVVNILSLQDYLKAVVPNELPPSYGLEAVRAQAVAARNYALRPRDKIWPQFDICDSQYCQAYYGAHTETPQTTQALAETEGLVAIYNGEVALTLYSSSHGGYAEAYSNAFSDPVTKQYPAPPIPYLSGGPDIPLPPAILNGASDLSSEEAARAFWTSRDAKSFDVKSPHYRWEKYWDRVQLEQLLSKTLVEVSHDKLTRDFISPLFHKGQALGSLQRITVTRRGVSGKAMTLDIQTSQGTWTVQKEFVIRKVFPQNGRMLPSANIAISHLTDGNGQLVGVKINGGGFGHGVGMSQLGASWMHQHGHGFADIIRHYYRGVAIGSIPLSVGTQPLAVFDSSGSAKTSSKTVLDPKKLEQAKPTMVTMPMQHTFYVKDPDMTRLVIRADNDPTPVRLLLNGRPLAVTLSGNGSLQVESSFPVKSYLKANALNTLVLFPDLKTPTRAIRAWVEAYPTKPGHEPVKDTPFNTPAINCESFCD